MEKNMFFVIPEMPSKTFVMVLKKLPGHFKDVVDYPWAPVCCRRGWSRCYRTCGRLRDHWTAHCKPDGKMGECKKQYSEKIMAEKGNQCTLLFFLSYSGHIGPSIFYIRELYEALYIIWILGNIERLFVVKLKKCLQVYYLSSKFSFLVIFNIFNFC